MSTENKLDILFKALGDARRRKILDLLKKGPMTTGDVCARLDELDRCTVMQHIGVLEKADLITVKREGRVRWNYLNSVPIKKAFDRWISEYAVDAVDLLGRLRDDLDG